MYRDEDAGVQARLSKLHDQLAATFARLEARHPTEPEDGRYAKLAVEFLTLDSTVLVDARRPGQGEGAFRQGSPGGAARR